MFSLFPLNLGSKRASYRTSHSVGSISGFQTSFLAFVCKQNFVCFKVSATGKEKVEVPTTFFISTGYGNASLELCRMCRELWLANMSCLQTCRSRHILPMHGLVMFICPLTMGGVLAENRHLAYDHRFRRIGTNCVNFATRHSFPGNLQRGIFLLKSETHERYEIIDFQSLPGIACPCGTAKRGLMDVPSVPYSLHLTEICAEAKVHYHKTITETYFFLECAPDAAMELDGQVVPVQPRTAIVIHPGTRHRAVGNMTIVLIASPKFDASDEWFD